MAAIEFPISSFPGQQPLESQGRLINCFTETDGDQSVIKSVPGLDLFVAIDPVLGPPRGFLDVDQYVYGAFEDCVLRIASDTAFIVLTGDLLGTDNVTWAKNNAVPKDVVVVAQTGVYVVTDAAVTPYADYLLPVEIPPLPKDLPANPTCCAGLDGYIFFGYGNGRIFATNLNSLAVPADSFTTAEANPDGVLRLIPSGRQLYAFGSATTEIYQNVGASPFPMARSAVIPVGIRSKFAVAGGSDLNGWDSTPLFVAADGTVRHFSGYDPQVVSTRSVERDISLVPSNELEAYVYSFYGHSIWGVKSSVFCWEYNISTGRWHERKSYGMEGWRGAHTIFAFDRWLMGDLVTSAVVVLNPRVRRERDDLLVLRMESKVGRSFPNRSVVSRADFMFAPGVGLAAGLDPIQTNPRVSISWSDDGGASWSVPLLRDIGREGNYRHPVRVNRTGMVSKVGRRWRLDVSDPVDIVFMGGTMEVEERE